MSKNRKKFEDFEEQKVGKKHRLTETLKKVIGKNAFSLSLLAICATVFAVSAAVIPRIAVYDIDASNEASGVENSEEVPPVSDKNESDIRIFREYGGKVGVFYKNGELDFVIDVEISSLSEYDRELLAKGVIADGSEEITMLAEGLTEMN